MNRKKAAEIAYDFRKEGHTFIEIAHILNGLRMHGDARKWTATSVWTAVKHYHGDTKKAPLEDRLAKNVLPPPDEVVDPYLAQLNQGPPLQRIHSALNLAVDDQIKVLLIRGILSEGVRPCQKKVE